MQLLQLPRHSAFTSQECVPKRHSLIRRLLQFPFSSTKPENWAFSIKAGAILQIKDIFSKFFHPSFLVLLALEFRENFSEKGRYLETTKWFCFEVHNNLCIFNFCFTFFARARKAARSVLANTINAARCLIIHLINALVDVVAWRVPWTLFVACFALAIEASWSIIKKLIWIYQKRWNKRDFDTTIIF